MDADLRDPATDEDGSATRWSGWLRPTAAELVGLAVLVLGSVVASLLWWTSSVTGPADLEGVLGAGSAVDGEGLADGPAAGVDHRHADHDPAGSGSGDTAEPVPDQVSGGQPGSGEATATEAGVAHEPSAGTAGQPEEPPAPVIVHLAGAVREPGVVTLEAGSRVTDAVAAAGGLSGDADPERVNLARVVADGEHIHVPRVGEELPDPPPTGPSTAGPSAGAAGPGSGGPVSGLIDLNRATAQELESLPGIGPSRAAAIVEYRERNGPFQVPGDLRGVSGIGEATFQNLSDLVTVG